MKVTHHTHRTSGRISVNRHGSCPPSLVATVTWHVVGLHGGKQEALQLAGSRSGLGESSSSAEAGGEGEKALGHMHTKVIIRFQQMVLEERKGEQKGGRTESWRVEEEEDQM